MHPNGPWSAQESSASVGVRQTLSARSLLPAANSPPSGEKPTALIGCDPLITTVGTNLRGPVVRAAARKTNDCNGERRKPGKSAKFGGMALGPGRESVNRGRGSRSDRNLCASSRVSRVRRSTKHTESLPPTFKGKVSPTTTDITPDTVSSYQQQLPSWAPRCW